MVFYFYSILFCFAYFVGLFERIMYNVEAGFLVVIEMIDVIRPIQILKVKLTEREGKEERKQNIQIFKLNKHEI